MQVFVFPNFKLVFPMKKRLIEPRIEPPSSPQQVAGESAVHIILSRNRSNSNQGYNFCTVERKTFSLSQDRLLFSRSEAKLLKEFTIEMLQWTITSVLNATRRGTAAEATGDLDVSAIEWAFMKRWRLSTSRTPHFLALT